MAEERQRIRLVSKKDLDVSYYCGSGAGGQKRNKTASGVQIIHRDSGAIGRACDTRSQDQNKHAAFHRLLKTPRFKVWLSRKLFELREQESMEAAVERSMSPDNLKIEIKDENGRWKEVDEAYFSQGEAGTLLHDGADGERARCGGGYDTGVLPSARATTSLLSQAEDRSCPHASGG